MTTKLLGLDTDQLVELLSRLSDTLSVDIIEVLNDISKQLEILNIHMSSITDIFIDKDDLG